MAVSDRGITEEPTQEHERHSEQPDADRLGGSLDSPSKEHVDELNERHSSRWSKVWVTGTQATTPPGLEKFLECEEDQGLP